MAFVVVGGRGAGCVREGSGGIVVEERARIYDDASTTRCLLSNMFRRDDGGQQFTARTITDDYGRRRRADILPSFHTGRPRLTDDSSRALALSTRRSVPLPREGRWRCIVLQPVTGQWAGRHKQ